MSRTYRRKNIPTPTWMWRYEQNPEKANAWFHSDNCWFGTDCSPLSRWAKIQLRQEARIRLNEMLMKAICNGNEEELSLPPEHKVADRWSYD